MPYLAGKASVAHGKVKITLDHLLPVSPQIQETVGKISRETPAVRANPLFAGREAIELAHQNHFGSQCATECVYRHLPAKVTLPRSHFGKPPLTERTLRHLPCQSELAEAPRAGNRKSSRKTKKGRAESFGPTRSNRCRSIFLFSPTQIFTNF